MTISKIVPKVVSEFPAYASNIHELKMDIYPSQYRKKVFQWTFEAFSFAFVQILVSIDSHSFASAQYILAKSFSQFHCIRHNYFMATDLLEVDKIAFSWETSAVVKLIFFPLSNLMNTFCIGIVGYPSQTCIITKPVTIGVCAFDFAI